MRSIFLGIAALVLTCTNSVANDPKLVKTFGDWSVYTYQDEKGTVCYLSAKPKKSEGNYKQRGDVRALLTLKPNGDGGTINLVAGYTYPANGKVTVHLAQQKFTLFTKDDGAWALDDKTDKTMLLAMAIGQQMIVKGKSDKGTETTDNYSMKGFADAYQAAAKACGGKR